MITPRHSRDKDCLFYIMPVASYSVTLLYLSVSYRVLSSLYLSEWHKPQSRNNFTFQGMAFPISLLGCCSLDSVHSFFACECLFILRPVQGFHTHLNHPSSILPHLLYSSPCLTLQLASWAEAQWSAVQRYITCWGGGGKRRKGARKDTDADMETPCSPPPHPPKKGGGEFKNPRGGIDARTDCYNSKHAAETTPFIFCYTVEWACLSK